MFGQLPTQDRFLIPSVLPTALPSVVAPIMPQPTLIPGARFLPHAIGSRLTIKNVVIGSLLAVGGYLAYRLLLPRKKTISGRWRN